MAEAKSIYRIAKEAYSVRTQISLSPHQREAIASFCRQTGVTMAEFIRRAIDRHLAWQEGQRAVMKETANGS